MSNSIRLNYKNKGVLNFLNEKILGNGKLKWNTKFSPVKELR